MFRYKEFVELLDFENIRAIRIREGCRVRVEMFNNPGETVYPTASRPTREDCIDIVDNLKKNNSDKAVFSNKISTVIKTDKFKLSIMEGKYTGSLYVYYTRHIRKL